MHTPRWEASPVRATVPHSRSAARPPRQRHWHRLGDASVPATVAPTPSLLPGNQQPCPCPHVFSCVRRSQRSRDGAHVESAAHRSAGDNSWSYRRASATASPPLVARSTCAHRHVTGTGKHANADEDERERGRTEARPPHPSVSRARRGDRDRLPTSRHRQTR